MWWRLLRRRGVRERSSSVPAPERPDSLEQDRAKLTQYFQESPEGRALWDEFFNATPEARATLEEHFRTSPAARARLGRSLSDEIRREQPTFLEALRCDAALYASHMFEPLQFKTGFALLREAVRLSWQSDAFFCLLLYRLRVRLAVHRVPVLPTVLHHLCAMLWQLDLGKNAVLEPGVYIPHGKVVIDGIVRVGRGTMITPWVTLGLTTSIQGPTIGRLVLIGTGAKILGPIQVGDRARIAANSVVFDDVPPGATVAGAPAKVVRVSADEENPPDRAQSTVVGSGHPPASPS